MASLADIHAERGLIAAIIAAPSLIDALPLPADAWSALAHEATYAAIRWVYDAGLRVTEATVISRLAHTGALSAAGGEQAVYDLAVGDGSLVPSGVLHARVLELAGLRRQREHVRRALSALDREDGAGAALHCASAMESAASEDGSTAFTLGEAVLRSYARLTGPDDPSMRRVPSGVDAVDREIVGHGRGDFVIVGARQNVGKTSFALHSAETGLARGMRAGVILVEDPAVLIEDRLMSRHSGVPTRALRARDLTAHQHELAAETAGVMSQLTKDQGFVVSCIPNGTDADIIKESSRLVRVAKCSFIIIDYIQAVRCSTREQDRRLAIHASAARFKAMGVRLGVPVILMSQLTTEKDEELKEPKMEDLRDCKDLVSIADTILVLWRKEKSSEAMVYGKVEKAKAEGVGTRFAFNRGPGGSLVECDVPAESSGGYERSSRR